MITEDYVSFETAKLLKEKGFNEMTELAYELEHDHIRSDLPVSYWRNSEIGKYKFSCPTLQMAMKWLREVHNYIIIIDYSPAYNKYAFDFYHNGKADPRIVSYSYNSYEQACEEAIKYYLENLI